MRKILYILLIIGVLISFFSIETNAETNNNYFVVTAYYSPLPNQDHYSYSVYTKRERTFEEEKRLQWEWIAWASWKWVFSWMLAAPKNYHFGTKIYLEWLGIWEVADRWGAIVNKWVRGYGYDRIDVWMWYGDEWLKRASYWGKRTIKWSIVNKNVAVNLDYKVIPSPNWVIKTSKYMPVVKKEIDIFKKTLTSVSEIKKLQEILTEMKLYSWKIDGNYKTTINSVYNFQLNKKVVKSEYSPWAWTYWPKTRKALKEEYEWFLVKKEEERLELVRIEEEKKKEEARKKELALKLEELKNISTFKADKKMKFIWNSKFWEISHWVRELQVTLKKLGYFDNKDTAIFWKLTKESIISYQLDKKIINSRDELWAWIIWPKTKKSLKDDLAKKYLKEIVKKENEIIKI